MSLEAGPDCEDGTGNRGRGRPGGGAAASAADCGAGGNGSGGDARPIVEFEEEPDGADVYRFGGGRLWNMADSALSSSSSSSSGADLSCIFTPALAAAASTSGIGVP